MAVEHFIFLFLAALFAGNDGSTAGGIITCWDPEGLCADIPCDCEGACAADSHCQEGYVCRQEPIGPSWCWCIKGDNGPAWGGSLDLAGRCEPEPVPTGPRGYTIIELGSLGGPESGAGAINNSGQIAGISSVAIGGKHAFLWEDGVMSDLTPWAQPNVFHNSARINESGQVIFKDPPTVYLWENGGLTHIADTVSLPALNDLGQVLMGTYIWDNGIRIEVSDLSDPPIEARAINNLGHLGGSIDVPGGKHAALLVDGEILDLGTLGGDRAFVWSMNDVGQAGGRSRRADDDPRNPFFGFLWTDGEMVDLGNALGLPFGTPGRINNCGEVLVSGGVFHPSRGYRNLESLIDPALRWYLGDGSGINERGQIAGGGTVFVPGLGWLGRAFLMTPVPGDLTLDGPIDLNDYAVFFGHFGHETTEYSIYCNRADFDEDGDTDLYDFGKFQTLFTGGQ